MNNSIYKKSTLLSRWKCIKNIGAKWIYAHQDYNIKFVCGCQMSIFFIGKKII